MAENRKKIRWVDFIFPVLYLVAFIPLFLYVFRDGFRQTGLPFLLVVPFLYSAWRFGPWVGALGGFGLAWLVYALAHYVGLREAAPELAFQVFFFRSVMIALIGFAAGTIGRGNRRLKIILAEKEETERQLKREKEKAEEASRAKSLFLANMSHEIRTPLNAILGTAELVAGTRLDHEQKEYVRVLEASSQTLLRLIGNSLDFARMEADRLELNRAEFDLFALIKEIETTLRPLARENGLQFNAKIDPRLARWRNGDPTRLSQILVNLVGNALKFTEEGSVNLSVEQDTDRADAIRVIVADTGPGIDSETLPRIFELFYQADSTSTRRHGGTGLGLALCKRLADAMQGTIQVKSEVGRGSEFEFRAPLGIAPDHNAEPPGKAANSVERTEWDVDQTRNKIEPDAEIETDAETDAETDVDADKIALKVLLVEDNPDNQFLFRAFLKNAPVELDIAADGLAGVEKFSRGSYQLVLMDMQMPKMDGFAATREIRSREAAAGREPTPIVALTAGALPEDRERSLAAGCDAHVTKPIKKEKLLKVVRDYTRYQDSSVP